jgi:four helix bundle protein
MLVGCSKAGFELFLIFAVVLIGGLYYEKKFRTLEFAIDFYAKVDEQKVTGNLRDQLLRAASSISLNLSEGNAKRTEKEKKRYYHTAYASCQECKTILRLAKIDESEINNLADKLGAWLYKLLKSEIQESKI